MKKKLAAYNRKELRKWRTAARDRCHHLAGKVKGGRCVLPLGILPFLVHQYEIHTGGTKP